MINSLSNKLYYVYDIDANYVSEDYEYLNAIEDAREIGGEVIDADTGEILWSVIGDGYLQNLGVV